MTYSATRSSYIDWNTTRSDFLEIISTLDLEHFPGEMKLAQTMIDPIADQFPFSYAPEEFPDLARSLERHYPDPDRKIDLWARSF